MPRYYFECRTCGDSITEYYDVDLRPDWTDCGCGGAMTRRFGKGLQHTDRTMLRLEQQRDKDIDAYKAMRKQGYQPPKIAGSHRLEAVSESKAELEWGQKFLTKEGRQMADEVRAQAGQAHQTVKDRFSHGMPVIE